MVNFIRRVCFARIIHLALLSSFCVTYAAPLQAMCPQCGIINEGVFLIRMKKLVEKLENSSDKSPEKIIEYLVDIKNEIEMTHNTYLDMNLYMDLVAKEFRQQGFNPKQQLDAIKKKIKKREKKVKHKSLLMTEGMILDGFPANAFDILYTAKHHHKDKKDNDNTEDAIELPTQLVYGVAVALCGFFLICLPYPFCKDWGARLVILGVGAAGPVVCQQNDKNKEKEKEKNKK